MKAADKRLLEAVQNGNLVEAKAAISKGANPAIIVKERGKIINTALSMACVNQSVDVAEYLISQGADINLADSRGQTPMMKSLLMAKKDGCFRLLLEKGADVAAKNVSGENIFDIVEKKGNSELLTLLLEKHERPSKEMPIAEAAEKEMPTAEAEAAVPVDATNHETITASDSEAEVVEAVVEVSGEKAVEEQMPEVDEIVLAEEKQPAPETVDAESISENPELETAAEEDAAEDTAQATEQTEKSTPEENRDEHEVSASTKEFLRTVSWQASGIRIYPASISGALPVEPKVEDVPHEPVEADNSLAPKPKNKVRRFFRSFFELFMFRKKNKAMAVRNKKKEGEGHPKT